MSGFDPFRPESAPFIYHLSEQFQPSAPPAEIDHSSQTLIEELRSIILKHMNDNTTKKQALIELLNKLLSW